jgi:hypothetical protein
MILNEGLHQGSLNDGYYLTRNHEIDIEFLHLDGGILSQPSLSNMKYLEVNYRTGMFL